MTFRQISCAFFLGLVALVTTTAVGQKIVNGIVIPPGASEGFAAFPADIRAILQPEAPLTLGQAQLPCVNRDTLDPKEDPVLVLETGKFALRAGEFERGHCWINRAAADQNHRAFVILGVLSLMGWGTPKDLDLAYRFFNGEAGREREPWAIYFQKQCFDNGWGTRQNKQSSINMESWLMSHEEGQNVYLAINADNVQMIKDYNRDLILLNPPMKTHQECNPNLLHQTQCHTITEVDQDRLNKQLSNSK